MKRCAALAALAVSVASNAYAYEVMTGYIPDDGWVYIPTMPLYAGIQDVEIFSTAPIQSGSIGFNLSYYHVSEMALPPYWGEDDTMAVAASALSYRQLERGIEASYLVPNDTYTYHPDGYFICGYTCDDPNPWWESTTWTADIDIGLQFDPKYAGQSWALSFFGPDFRSVPEPATWTLMVGGFLLAGWSLRRRAALGAT